jgi:predicted metal-dependent peptidase
MQNKTYNIDNVMTRLLLEEPLWSRVSRYINKVESNQIPTAGVRITDDGHFELMYNPDFMRMLKESSNRDTDDRFSILRHELLHITLSHVFDERLEGLPHVLKNIAYDLAINSHIDNLKTFHERYVVNPITGERNRKEDATPVDVPYYLCVPGVKMYADYPSGLSAEEYAELLKKDYCEKCGQPKDEKGEKKSKSKKDKKEQKQGNEKGEKQKGKGEKQEQKDSGEGESGEKDDSQQQGGNSGDGEGQEGEQEGQGHGCSSCSSCGKPQNGNGQGQGQGSGSGDGVIDDHNWGSGNDEARQIARERMREILREAVNEINNNNLGWGSTPVTIREQIIKFVNGTIDWRKVLSYFVQSSVKVDRRNTMKKINRRFPYIHAGRTQNRTANIAISIDQSGSVGDDMLQAFFGELNKLATLVTFTVIPFDCSVDESLIEIWKKGQKQTAKRVKHGGTDFDAPTKYVNEAGIFDAHIILTDMQAPKPIPSRVPRMWMTTEDCLKHVPFSTTERVIPITTKR